MKLQKHVITGALLLAMPVSALAGSSALTDFSAKSAGRGTAVTAVADGPSQLFYNPANIARLPGLQVDAAIEAVMPRWGWAPLPGESGTATKSDVGVATPPSLNLSYNFGKVGGLGDIAAGIGFASSYGAAFSWPDDWAGNQELQKLDLKVFELIPALAWRPNKYVAVGAGFRYLPSTMYTKRAVSFGSESTGTVELSGAGKGYGATAGITIMPLDTLAFGIGWRSATTLKFEGDSHFAFPAPYDTSAIDGTAKMQLPTAQVIRAGVAYDLLPKRFNVSADIEAQLWSKYKALKVRLFDPDGNKTVADSPANSKDSYVIHAGGEYVASKSLALRAGYSYDRRTLPQSTVSPASPDSDRHTATIGASYMLGDVAGAKNVGVHLNVADTFFAKRTTYTAPFAGQYTGGWAGGTTIYVFGIGLTAAFDAGSGASAFAAPAPDVAEPPAITNTSTSAE